MNTLCRKKTSCFTVLLAMLLTACDPQPEIHTYQPESMKYRMDSDEDLEKQGIWDPLEGWNRAMFGLNDILETVLWEPVTKVYQTMLPPILQEGIQNVAGNVNQVFSVLNSAAQLSMEKFGVHFGRFIVNTVFGLGGLIDVASDLGINAPPEDLGKTLKSYGVPPGPFLVLPLLGPVVLRDSLGRATLGATCFFFPLGFIPYAYTGLEGVHIRKSLAKDLNYLQSSYKDIYGAARRIYYKMRGDFIEVDTLEDDEKKFSDIEQEIIQEKDENVKKEKEEKTRKMEESSNALHSFKDDFMANSPSDQEDLYEGCEEGDCPQKSGTPGAAIAPNDAHFQRAPIHSGKPEKESDSMEKTDQAPGKEKAFRKLSPSAQKASLSQSACDTKEKTPSLEDHSAKSLLLEKESGPDTPSKEDNNTQQENLK